MFVQVAATGNMSSKRPEADNIWVELGRTRRQLARLEDTVNMSVAIERDPPPAPCVDTMCQHWPFSAEEEDEGVTSDVLHKDCRQNLCCYFLHPSCLVGIKGSDDMPVNISQPLHTDDPCHRELQSLTAQEWRDHYNCSVESCLFFASQRELQVLEFGWGLFHTTQDSGKTCNSRADDQSGAKLPADEQKFAGHLHKWFHRDKYEHEPTLFIMFSYLVMLVVSFLEVRQALNLLMYSVAKSGLLPEFYKPSAPGVVPAAHENLPWWSRAFVVAAPVVQLFVAFVLSSCGGALFLCTDMQDKRASIIFNAVALSFILELDDKIGLLMMSERQWSSCHNSMQRCATSVQAICKIGSFHEMAGHLSGGSSSSYNSRTASTGCADMSRCSRPKVGGHVVFGIVGWLLLAHSLLIAPQTPAQMLAFLTTAWAYVTCPSGAGLIRDWTSSQEGMIAHLFMDPHVRFVDYVDPRDSVWTTFAFKGFPGLTTLKQAGPGVALGRTAAIWICSIYVLLAVATVLLLCHSLLPCSDKATWWPLALTVVQVALVVVAHMQYISAVTKPFGQAAQPSATGEKYMVANAFGFVAVLSFLVVFWFGMFVVWPFTYSKTYRAMCSWLRKHCAALLTLSAQCSGVVRWRAERGASECATAAGGPPAAAGVQDGDSMEAGVHAGDTAQVPARGQVLSVLVLSRLGMLVVWPFTYSNTAMFACLRKVCAALLQWQC